ncbi:restriction endonuclease subunit S [Macellibacteroides fermentans]|jgi:type I restriction enzyme S subunit|uniref:restriction endonuclease subunit S n=1 Tax=Macellibacteroides fermentans TaxID=879969 RepID=UPI003B925E78
MNYKLLGNYIREVNIRNTELKVENLLGVSIQKAMIPSIANTVGTDMSTYKIVKQGQFAYGPVTSRNGDKISIALLNEDSESIISQAYISFEVIDIEKLLPEYLMMWFRRPEFDRYARFKSHGSTREIFDWDEMCNTKLPIPSPEKQREIVAEYNTLQNRINLNKQLIQKLEETAQTIYKQWFVDFEFPNKEGKPYKNSGGEMMESEFGEVPKGWRKGKLKEIISFYNGKVKPSNQGKYPVYGGNGIVEYVDSYNDENTIIVGRVGAYCGSLFLEKNRCWISDNAISAKPLKNIIMFCLYTLHNLNLNERSEGTGQPLITQTILNNIDIVIPSEKVIQAFEEKISIINKNVRLFAQQDKKLTELQSLLLSKMARIEN